MDFLFDDISRGRRIKVLNVTDEFTRESIAGQVARSITARDTVAVLQGIVGTRGAPANILLRQRARIHRPCAAELVREEGIEHPLHRARLTMAESVSGVLQRQDEKGAPERRADRLRAGGPGAPR